MSCKRALISKPNDTTTSINNKRAPAKKKKKKKTGMAKYQAQQARAV